MQDDGVLVCVMAMQILIFVAITSEMHGTGYGMQMLRLAS